MKILFVDTDPDRAKRFLELYPQASWCYSSYDAIEQLSLGDTEALFVEHDLDSEPFMSSHDSASGMGVVEWLEEQNDLFQSGRPCTTTSERMPIIRHVICHSHNSQAVQAMCVRLTEIGYHALAIPWYKISKDADGASMVRDFLERNQLDDPY